MQEINQIQDKVREFIRKTSYISGEKLSNDTLIFSEGIMDSMGFISIIGFIEEDFSIETLDDELVESNFESIDAISGFVKRKLQNS